VAVCISDTERAAARVDIVFRPYWLKHDRGPLDRLPVERDAAGYGGELKLLAVTSREADQEQRKSGGNGQPTAHMTSPVENREHSNDRIGGVLNLF
jgi:hypothetical protein